MVMDLNIDGKNFAMSASDLEGLKNHVKFSLIHGRKFSVNIGEGQAPIEVSFNKLTKALKTAAEKLEKEQNLGTQGGYSEMKAALQKLKNAGYDEKGNVIAKGVTNPLTKLFTKLKHLSFFGASEKMLNALPKTAREKEVADLESLANKGDAQAQYSLGMCYLRGDGVVMDVDKAVPWLKRAAEGGNIDAKYEIGRLYFEGKPSFIDTAPKGIDKGDAIFHLGVAAMAKHPGAQYQLGRCYYHGLEKPQNLEMAQQHFENAAHAKDPKAALALAVLLYKTEGNSSKVQELISLSGEVQYTENPSLLENAQI